MKDDLKSSLYWLLANVLGMSAYLFFEALTLAPRSEPNMEPGSGQVCALIFIGGGYCASGIKLNLVNFHHQTQVF